LRLSGGQRQRLALARAFYRDAPILILDEATSALDGATEAAILEPLVGTAGLTVLIATHRTEALLGCDMFLLFDGGEVVASRDVAVASRPPRRRIG
jgi:ABC-type multidrug transport system fused ATPase/permease subunit